LKLEQKFVPTVACDFGETNEQDDHSVKQKRIATYER
jgi:hypothetical protein